MRDVYDGAIEVDPSELVRVFHDFSPLMDIDETIASLTTTAVRRVGTVDMSATALVSIAILNDFTTQYGFEATVTSDGDDFDITIMAYTTRIGSIGQRLKAKHLIRVRER